MEDLAAGVGVLGLRAFQRLRGHGDLTLPRRIRRGPCRPARSSLSCPGQDPTTRWTGAGARRRASALGRHGRTGADRPGSGGATGAADDGGRYPTNAVRLRAGRSLAIRTAHQGSTAPPTMNGQREPDGGSEHRGRGDHADDAQAHHDQILASTGVVLIVQAGRDRGDRDRWLRNDPRLRGTVHRGTAQAPPHGAVRLCAEFCPTTRDCDLAHCKHLRACRHLCPRLRKSASPEQNTIQKRLTYEPFGTASGPIFDS